jgi:rhamnose transport system permease protein
VSVAALLRAREAGLALLLVAVFAFFAIRVPAFRSPGDMLDQSRYWVEIGLLSGAVFAVILAGGIDLSVGSIMALCGVAIARLHFEAGLPAWLAAAAGLAIGAAAGTLNGVIIAFGRIPDLVATLATLIIYRGLAHLAAANRVHSGFPDWYRWLGEGSVLGVMPAQWALLLAFWAALLVLLERTRFGRRVAAIGASRDAARAAGVPVRWTRVALYTLSGAAAALGAIVYTARYNTAKPDDGTGLELEVVTCVFLGGASMRGGRGTLGGVILGVLVVGFLRTGLILMSSTEPARRIAIGALLIAAAAWNEMLAARRRSR